MTTNFYNEHLKFKIDGPITKLNAYLRKYGVLKQIMVCRGCGSLMKICPYKRTKMK